MRGTIAHRHRIVGVFVLALALRLGAVVYLDNIHTPEMWEDGAIARNLVEGRGFSYDWLGPMQPTSFAAPFYPFFLALFYYVFGIAGYTYVIIQVLQALISSLTCVVVYKTGKRLFNEPVGLIAAVASCFYPVFIYSTTQVIRVTFIVFYVSLLMLYLLKLSDLATAKHRIVLGILFGITILSEPIMALFMVFSMAWLMWTSRERKVAFKSVVYVSIVTALLILPWTVRNYFVHGRVMFIKTQIGYALWIGNNPDATGTGRRFADVSTPVKTWGQLRKELNAEALTEIECDDVLKRRALSFIKEHPRKCASLALKKLYYFWWYDKTHPLARSVIYVVPHAIVLAFAILGLMSARMNRIGGKGLSLIFVLFLSLTIPYVVTYVLPRYRMPLEPYLVILSALGIQQLCGLWHERSRAASSNGPM